MSESIIMTVEMYEALKGVTVSKDSFAEREGHILDEYERLFSCVCEFVSAIKAETAFIEAAHKYLDPDTIYYLNERLREMEEAPQ